MPSILRAQMAAGLDDDFQPITSSRTSTILFTEDRGSIGNSLVISVVVRDCGGVCHSDDEVMVSHIPSIR